MNKIKYFFFRSLETLDEHGFIYFFKVVLGRMLGKNLEFIDFAFKKGGYFFRGSEIGFAMIRNSFEYMNSIDFEKKYALMIKNLDDESIKTVDLFIKHIRLFYYNNVVHESELFSEREQRLQEKSVKFMGETGVLHPTGYGIFESPEILASISSGIVFDVGASDGVESMMFAKLIPSKRKIYAFEPSSYNFKRLQNHIQNSPYSDSIFPQQIALGEMNGEMEIFGAGGAEVSLIQLDHTPVASETVRVMSIDSFIETNSLERVGLIKWDIEGAEIESILGAKKTIMRDKPVLVVSIYHNGREFFETKPLLESWISFQGIARGARLYLGMSSVDLLLRLNH